MKSYVDNCFKSMMSEEDAKALVDQLQETLGSGGLELRQWASNRLSVTAEIRQHSIGNGTRPAVCP